MRPRHFATGFAVVVAAELILAAVTANVRAGGSPIVVAARVASAALLGIVLVLAIGCYRRWIPLLAKWIKAGSTRFVFSARVAGLKACADVAGRRLLPISSAESGVPAELGEVAFQASVSQNPYLPPAGTEVHAVFEVSAVGGTATIERAEVIILDCSGSMGRPWARLRAARRATAVALDLLPDGTWFAIIRGDHEAAMIYPPTVELVRATAESRAGAARALRWIWPAGGTAMGRWLLLARDLFATHPAAIAHALLVSDGCNESERGEDLEAALHQCAGAFQCDCRGVGTDWDVEELRAISSALLGSVDVIPNPAGLVSHFEEITAAAVARSVDGVELEVWLPTGANLRFLRQTAPELDDLAARATLGERSTRYPLGAWGSEIRHYHLCVDVPSRAIGQEVLASRVRVLVGGRAVAEACVRAIWTDDESLWCRADAAVVHYQQQAELVDHVRRGLRAHDAADEAEAIAEFGAAAHIAAAAGNDAAIGLLSAVVEVDEARTGMVRFRADVERADTMALDTRSTRTVRFARLAVMPPPRSQAE